MKYLGKTKFDSVILGTVLGLLAPLLVFVIYYLVAYRGMNLPAFLHYLGNGEMFLPLISLYCAGSNLLLFFIFIWTNRDKSARGVLQATFVYAIYVCIMKLI